MHNSIGRPVLYDLTHFNHQPRSYTETKGEARQGYSLAGLVVLLPILLLLSPTTPVLLKLVLIPLERAVALHFE
jgi:hypothetical protein